jgi:hypothetical protein
MIVHESDNRSGGLLLLWRDHINVRLQGITKNYINVLIEDEGSWRFMGIYGELDWSKKNKDMGCNVLN